MTDSGDIYQPRSQGSYGVQSGTSMATPFTAAAAALILQKRGKGKENALAVRGLLQNTGKAVPSSKKSGDPLQTLAQAGAGLLDVYEAVHGKTVVTPGKPAKHALFTGRCRCSNTWMDSGSPDCPQRYSLRQT